MKKLILCFLLSVPALIVCGQTVKLSREKQILLLHNIDSLIRKYEIFSTLSEGNKISENQKEKFLSFFLNDYVSVFDDISPNYLNNNETTVNEKQKPVSVYMKDISDNYTNLYCKLKETDAGTLYKRLIIDKDGLVVTVKIEKETQAFLKNATGARFETLTYQDLSIRIKDTISCEPLIAEIVKSGTSKWNYVAPFSKVSKWEKVFTLKAELANFKYGGQVSESIITDPKPIAKPGFGFECEFRYLFKNYETYKIGGSFGLGISYLRSDYTTQGYQSANQVIDKDNDTYYQIINSKPFSEKQTFYGIDVPIKFSYEKSFSYKNGFYFKLGAVLSYYMGSYSTSTVYTSLGYYPQYNVTLQDIPSLGFNKDKSFSGKGKLPINPINAMGNIELGMFFKLKNKSQLYIGLNYNQAFLNFSSKGKTTSLIALSKPDPTQSPVPNSIMSEMNNINLSMIGITIGIKKLPKTASNQKIVNYLKLSN